MALRPGDVVVIDSLSSHKVRGLRDAIESAAASVLYLLAYSPDLKPDRTGVRGVQATAA